MAIEKLAEEHARLQGYLTVVRVPFYKKKGHGDFDVIGFKPAVKGRPAEVLVIQCKARGPPDSYPRKNTGAGLRDLRKQVIELKADWRSFTDGRKTNKWGFRTFDKIRLVVDGYFPDDSKEKIRRELNTIAGCDVEILPIHEMIEQLFLLIKEDKNNRRKRYPDTALEMLRWLLRGVENKALSLRKLEEELE